MAVVAAQLWPGARLTGDVACAFSTHTNSLHRQVQGSGGGEGGVSRRARGSCRGLWHVHTRSLAHLLRGKGAVSPDTEFAPPVLTRSRQTAHNPQCSH